jgi:hypothetical protein
MKTLLVFILIATQSYGIDTQKIDGYLKNAHFQGNALIAKDGHILFHQGYGFVNEEYLIPITYDYGFFIGPNNKPPLDENFEFWLASKFKVFERGGYKYHLDIADILRSWRP